MGNNRKGNRSTRRYQSAVVVGFVVLAVGLSASCAQYKAPTILPAIAPRFGLDADASAWVMSIFTLMSIFFALPAGGMAQRFGFKKVMLASSALIVIGSAIGLLAGNNSVVLIVSRAIEGISLTFITTCAPIAIQRCVNPTKIGIATGIWGCWGNGGAVIASVLTPHLFGIAGFEGVWVFFAVVAAVAALLLLFLVREPETAAKAESDSEMIPDEEAANLNARAGGGVDADASRNDGSVADAHDTGRYRELLTPNVALFMGGFVGMNIIMLAILGLLPSVLQLPEKGFSMEMSGFATTFASLLSLVSTPLFGTLATKVGRIKPLLVLTLAVLGPCVLVLYTQTGVLFWAAATLLGAIGFGCVGLLIAAWMEIIPRPQLVAKGMGVLTLMQGIGQFLGTFLVQMLLGTNLEGWGIAGVVLCAIGVAGAVCVAFARFK